MAAALPAATASAANVASYWAIGGSGSLGSWRSSTRVRTATIWARMYGVVMSPRTRTAAEVAS